MHRILFAVLIIIIIYIIVKLFTKNANLVYVMPANKEQVVLASSLTSSSGTTTNNCTYSIWFYVNDWSVNYGDEKVVFQRSPSSTGAVDLSVYLGSYEQSLFVKTAILADGKSSYTTSSDGFLNGKSPCKVFTNNENVTTIPQAEKVCNTNNKCIGFSYVTPAWVKTGVNFYENTGSTGSPMSREDCGYLSFDDYNASNTPTSNDSGFYGLKYSNNYKTCTIPNIELQKWNNVILSATTNSMDIYINGTLTQTCDLGGEINILNTSNVYLSPGGKGFNGWNSKFQFWNYYINPAQANAIYRRGHGGSNTGSLDYKLNVTLYNGSAQKGTVTI